jgi:2-C-methyl-D-erythritol 4-phosphate cytidylyltransferase
LSLSAIIVAAGSSTRVGFDKLFAPIAGQPVIQYSLEAFEQAACVDEIIVVCRETAAASFSKLIAATKMKKVRAVVRGAARRQDSVAAGLKAVSASAAFVAVHDAARPLIMPHDIERVLCAAQEHGAAVLAAAVTDTLKLANADQFICGAIERENVFAMQTPQIFSRELLASAYERVTQESRSITDEVSAVQMSSAKVAIVPTQNENMKITFARDLPVAEFILRQRRTSSS